MQFQRSFILSLSLAFALAGSLVVAAGAAGGKRTRPATRTRKAPGPAVKPAVKRPPRPLADLILERFDVTDAGEGKFELTAVLRNGPSPASAVYRPLRGEPYPGGGRLVISRTTGATVLTGEEDSAVVLPALYQELAARPIPPLAYGEAIEVTAIAEGRAIFTAGLVSDGIAAAEPPPALPEKDPGNNSQTVNKLKPGKVLLTNKLLQAFLGKALSDMRVRLDRDDSYVVIPALGVEERWKIPEMKKPVDALGVRVGRVRYHVHDINTRTDGPEPGVSLELKNYALLLFLRFETEGNEVRGSGLAPNIQAEPLDIRIRLPISYNADKQYLYYQGAQVRVNANWSFNGPLSPVLDDYLKDVNRSLESRLRSLAADPRLKRKVELAMNRQIRELIKGGRIVNAEIDPDEIRLLTEVP
jgi:hypothetical protein